MSEDGVDYLEIAKTVTNAKVLEDALGRRLTLEEGSITVAFANVNALIDIAQTLRAGLAKQEARDKRWPFTYSEGGFDMGAVTKWEQIPQSDSFSERLVVWGSARAHNGYELLAILFASDMAAFEAAWAEYCKENG